MAYYKCPTCKMKSVGFEKAGYEDDQLIEKVCPTCLPNRKKESLSEVNSIPCMRKRNEEN